MAKKIKEKKKVVFRLEKIQTNKFTFSLPTSPFDKAQKERVEYSIISIPKASIEKELLNISLSVLISIKETQEIVCEIESNFIYWVENLASYQKDGKPEFENDFLITFFSISVSTMRGILYERCRGTFLQADFLPIINPTDFFKSIETIEN